MLTDKTSYAVTSVVSKTRVSHCKTVRKERAKKNLKFLIASRSEDGNIEEENLFIRIKFYKAQSNLLSEIFPSSLGVFFLIS